MDRRRIADVLEEVATLLELKGENPFRANSYRNAARTVLQIEGDIPALIERGELTQYKGIGDTLAAKIAELVETGKLKLHEKLCAETPAGLLDMLQIHGFGPKRAFQVHEQLGIASVAELKEACLDGRIAALKGFGEKTATKILDGIEFLSRSGLRMLYPQAWGIAERLKKWLLAERSVKQVIRRLEICGSLRRCRETIKDIDLLVASDHADRVMDRFVAFPDVRQVMGHGPTKSSIQLDSGATADLRVVTPAQFPFALHYFTGSKEHNIAVRALAQDLGLKLNEYELVGEEGPIACADERDLFAALGLAEIPPELREDTGEIGAAADHKLPRLIEPNDVTGCFHCHTNFSDGTATLAEMAHAARELGYAYLGIADHSQTAAYAGGLTVKRIQEQHDRIDEFNAQQRGFQLFKGIESDILPDGSLDYDWDVLARFDYVVASVHSALNQDADMMTNRLIQAIRHPFCTMLGHPTGRLLLQRDGSHLDLEKILHAAAAHEVMIEINANPHRLDLDWLGCKRAKALGVMLVINPDAHGVAGIADVQYGVQVARRGWLEKSDVFNTQPLPRVKKLLAQRRQRALEKLRRK